MPGPKLALAAGCLYVREMAEEDSRSAYFRDRTAARKRKQRDSEAAALEDFDVKRRQKQDESARKRASCSQESSHRRSSDKEFHT